MTTLVAGWLLLSSFACLYRKRAILSFFVSFFLSIQQLWDTRARKTLLTNPALHIQQQHELCFFFFFAPEMARALGNSRT